MKPEVYRHGSRWDCRHNGAVWQFGTWWQAISCALVIASGQTPWMFPAHISRDAE
jgi:hypothetical protein